MPKDKLILRLTNCEKVSIKPVEQNTKKRTITAKKAEEVERAKKEGEVRKTRMHIIIINILLISYYLSFL